MARVDTEAAFLKAAKEGNLASCQEFVLEHESSVDVVDSVSAVDMC
jgi:hypothetical protein